MPDHRIRLRASWQVNRLDQPPSTPSRRDLPTFLIESDQVAMRWERSFQRPTTDPSVETQLIRLEKVPGIRRALLNGQQLAIGPISDEGLQEYVIPETTPRRCLLALEYDPTLNPFRAASDRLWGEVSLVIRTVAET